MAPSYTEARATAWLAWLARGMQRQGQTVFLIEQLEPGWLRDRRQVRLYTLASRLTGGLLLGLILGPTLGLVFRSGLILGMLYRGPLLLGGGPGYWLMQGLIFGLILGLVFGTIVALLDISQFGARGRWAGLLPEPMRRPEVIYVLVTGILGALIYGLIYGPRDALLYGVSGGMLYGLIWGVRAGRRNSLNDIQTVETLRPSWAQARRGAAAGLVLGLAIGLISGLINRLMSGPVVVLTAALSFGLLGALMGALFGGFTPALVEMKTVPNEGIRLTLRNAFLTAVRIGPPLGLVAGLVFGLRYGPAYGLVFGLSSMLSFGLSAGFWYGGLDVTQHTILRVILCHYGYTPWDYARFLDYAARELGFLQKVGGGYIFIHRLLLERFAEMADGVESS